MTRLSALAVAVALAACVPTAADTQYWLDDVPNYNWYGGCAPTAGGTAIGYWDHQPGYGNLYHGTAPLYADDSQDPLDDIYHAIASQEHLGSTYNRDECTHTDGPNSLACFMHADPDRSGSAASRNIATGMRRYAEWDNPETSTNESANFSSVLYCAPQTTWSEERNRASMGFDDLRWEIDHGRPLMLGLSLDGGGHEVLAYGYRVDDMGNEWFAVRDTWQDGDSNGSYGIISETIDDREWWRWDEHSGQSFGAGYYIDHGTPFVPDDDGPVDEAQVGEFSDSIADAWTIDTSIETIYGGLSSGDEDWYRVWLDAGESYVAMTQDDEGYDTAIDTMIRLYNPDGNYVNYTNDTFGIPGVSLLWWEADKSGWWSFAVAPGGYNGEGQYALNTYHRDMHNPEPGTILMLCVGLAGVAVRKKLKDNTSED
jgi:hypothetical protein